MALSPRSRAFPKLVATAGERSKIHAGAGTPCPAGSAGVSAWQCQSATCDPRCSAAALQDIEGLNMSSIAGLVMLGATPAVRASLG
jgi:hypothetical protein